MTKLQVLIIGDICDNEAYKLFAAKFHCFNYKVTTREKFIVDMREKFSQVKGIYSTWGSFSKVGGINGELLASLPPGLQVIATTQIGYEEFNIQELNKRNIILTNFPNEIAYENVADLVLFNTIQSFRNFKMFDAHFNGKNFQTNYVRDNLQGATFDQESGKLSMDRPVPDSWATTIGHRQNRTPRGHNAVIVGLGGIGKAIAVRLAAIGMNIHYVKKTKLTEEQEKQLPFKTTFHKSLTDTTEIADLIIIACPGNAETRHMINEELVNSMAKQIRIINIGRGFTVDEDALVNGLKSGKVLFAGLDVFEREPTVHPGLIGREDVVLTPHIGSSSVELAERAIAPCLRNIEQVLEGSDDYTNRAF